MKILSVRRGFLADHSSTSYEFLAVDRPLSAKARAAVSRLSSRAEPSAKRVSFIYHAEGSDIPGGWEPLLRKHYDVMYSESYDWWTLAVAFNTSDQSLVAKLKQYAFYGEDDLGVSVKKSRNRVIVAVNCRLDAGGLYYGAQEDAGGIDAYLLGVLTRLRSCLMRGQCDPLYAVWQEYGLDDDEEESPPPKPRKTAKGGAVAAELAGIMAES